VKALNSQISPIETRCNRVLPKIYTRSGDKGYTSLPLFKKHVPKDHPALEVMGTLDELNSYIGLARSLLPREKQELVRLDNDLKEIQSKLFRIGSMIIGFGDRAHITREDVKWLEEKIDEINTRVQLSVFVLPTGHRAAAALHVARTICRRLERRIVSLTRLLPGVINEVIVEYINRLSDYLYAAALYVNHVLGVGEEELKW